MSNDEQTAAAVQSPDQEGQTERNEIVGDHDQLIAENEDLLTKMKVVTENMKNLLQSTGKCDNNNREADSALSSQVNNLNISNEDVPETGQTSVILNKENNSLKSISAAYDSDSSSSSSSSEDESDDSESSSSSDSVFDFIAQAQGAIKKRDNKPKEPEAGLMAEMGLDALPPVPNLSTLSLNSKKEDYFHMGHIRAIIDRIVTVESVPNIPAYDLDTILFYGEDDKRPLGQVFDVIGQVTAPTYALRFNSTKEIDDAGIQKGMRVFSAPKSNLTNYVFVKELMKMKGTDASWIDDAEVPDDMQEFSDDEAERSSKSVSSHNRKRQHGSEERYKKYERTMNECNTLNTRVHRLIDASKTLMRNPNPPNPTNRLDWSAATPYEIAKQTSSYDMSRAPPGFSQSPNYAYSFYDQSAKITHLSGPNVQVYENTRQSPWHTPWVSNNRNVPATNNRVPRSYTIGMYNYPSYTVTSPGQSVKDGGGPSEPNVTDMTGHIPNPSPEVSWFDLPTTAPSTDIPGIWTQNIQPPPPPPSNVPQGNWSLNTSNPRAQDPSSYYKYS